MRLKINGNLPRWPTEYTEYMSRKYQFSVSSQVNGGACNYGGLIGSRWCAGWVLGNAPLRPTKVEREPAAGAMHLAGQPASGIKYISPNLLLPASDTYPWWQAVIKTSRILRNENVSVLRAQFVSMRCETLCYV